MFFIRLLTPYRQRRAILIDISEVFFFAMFFLLGFRTKIRDLLFFAKILFGTSRWFFGNKSEEPFNIERWYDLLWNWQKCLSEKIKKIEHFITPYFLRKLESNQLVNFCVDKWTPTKIRNLTSKKSMLRGSEIREKIGSAFFVWEEEKSNFPSSLSKIEWHHWKFLLHFSQYYLFLLQLQPRSYSKDEVKFLEDRRGKRIRRSLLEDPQNR